MISIEIRRTDLDEERDVGTYNVILRMPALGGRGTEYREVEDILHYRPMGWASLALLAVAELTKQEGGLYGTSDTDG